MGQEKHAKKDYGHKASSSKMHLFFCCDDMEKASRHKAAPFPFRNLAAAKRIADKSKRLAIGRDGGIVKLMAAQ